MKVSANYFEHINYTCICKQKNNTYKSTGIVNRTTAFKSADIIQLRKSNISFNGYRNLIKLSPYEALKNVDSAKALEDYIRNGMFIHVPPIKGKKFGDVFWEHFIREKSKFEQIADSDVIYAKLRKLAETLSSSEELDRAALKQVSERASALGKNVKNLLDGKVYIKPDSVYLDVGCGNGEVAKCLSENLNLAPDAVKGLEIIERDDFCNIPRLKFDGKNIPKSIKKPDLVTIFNVLHHTRSEQEAQQLLKSVYQHMKSGGTLIIRDHNASSANDVTYWQIRHLLPIKVSRVDPPCLVQDTVYHTLDEWIKILTNIGFKTKFEKKDNSFNNIYSFYLIMQK